jgi:hypothetical protein
MRSKADLYSVVLLVGVGAGMAAAQDKAPGLLVRLYDVGAELRWLPELVGGEPPNAVKVVPTLDLSLEHKDFAALESNFLTEVTGQIKIERAGEYTFRLISDDGAQLWLDGGLLIDNDGTHGPAPMDGALALQPGPHELRVLHFQDGGGALLTLQWQPPVAAGAPPAEAGFELIPAALLSHPAGASVETAPGPKKVIAALRKGRPGDGTPMTKAHPGFEAGPGEKTPVASVKANFLQGGKAQPPAWLGPDTSPGFALGGATGQLFVQTIMNGVYTGQSLIWDPSRGEGKRLFVDSNPRFTQSCVFRVSTQMSGEHFELTGTPVFEMQAVRATRDGLQIVFTKPLDPRVGWDRESFYIEQWPFDLEKGVAPHRDGIVYPVKGASVMPDPTRIFLEIDNLMPSHVVYLRLLPPCLSKDGELPWSTEAWYTLHVIPPRQGMPMKPPPKEPQNVLTEAERQAGWRLLFDGQTTKGWHGYKKDAFPDGWKVEDGRLVRVGPAGDLITDDEFRDFELSIEWRISAGGNSGIMYRVSEDHDFPWQTGPEYQILDNSEHADGKNPLTSAASCYALYAPIKDATVPVGFFNQARIVVHGNHVEHWLNGAKVVEYELGSPEWQKLVAESKFGQMPDFGRRPKGKIVLQDHGDKVWYRNIKIREIK